MLLFYKKKAIIKRKQHNITLKKEQKKNIKTNMGEHGLEGLPVGR